MKLPARAAISFILGPTLVLAGLIGWVALFEGLAAAREPEGLAYLVAFAAFALPGLFAALLLTWYLETRTRELNVIFRLVFAGLTGVVVTSVIFSLVFKLVAGWAVTSDPLVLILPALIGVVSCALFFVTGGRRRGVAA